MDNTHSKYKIKKKKDRFWMKRTEQENENSTSITLNIPHIIRKQFPTLILIL